MTTAAKADQSPIIRGHDDGDRRWFYGGGVHTWHVRGGEVGEAFMIFEDQMTQGKMTPLHSHPDSDETMHLLEGEILMHMDGVEHRIGVGGTAVAPRGVPHAFLVTSPVARMLCLHTPGCCESFYWGASEPITSAGADPTGPVDFDRVRTSALANGGIEILGPPPFERP